MARIATVTGAWNRPAITRLVMHNMNSLDSEHELVHHIALSPEDEHFKEHLSSANLYEYHTVVVPNRPLIEKFNAAVQLAKKSDPDAIFLYGSDDIVTADFISQMYEALKDVDYVYPSLIHFYHVPSGVLISRHLPQTGIRMFTRRAVDEMNWVLFTGGPGAMALDSALDKVVEEALIEKSGDLTGDAVIVDLKDGVTHRIEFRKSQYNAKGDDVEAIPFFLRHFPDTADEIMALQKV